MQDILEKLLLGLNQPRDNYGTTKQKRLHMYVQYSMSEIIINGMPMDCYFSEDIQYDMPPTFPPGYLAGMVPYTLVVKHLLLLFKH